MISFVTIMISLEHDFADIGENYQYNVNDCDDFDDYCDGISDDRAEIGKLACRMQVTIMMTLMTIIMTLVTIVRFGNS